MQAVDHGFPGQDRASRKVPGRWRVQVPGRRADEQELGVVLDQRGRGEVGDAVAVAAGDQLVDLREREGAGHGVRRSGTTSVRWCGIVGRAASGVASRATIVTGCWQWGQFRVAVGSSGSRTAAGCREAVRTGGGGGSSIRAGSAGGAWPRRRARSSSRARSRRCSASRRQTAEQ